MTSLLNENKYWKKLLLGIGFTFLIASIGYLLALVPGFNLVGPLGSAIVLAIIYRQIFGYPDYLRIGIQFSSKYLLRFAIILYGLKLNIDVIFDDGLGLLAKGAVAILFSILLTVYLAKLFKANQQLALLLGVGTGVCGAAAIAAVSPVIKAKEEDTAIGVGIIALVGTIFSIIYALLQPILPLTEIQYGTWAGLSLHELAHVALAAEPAGEEALAVALLAKLGRVFLLVPLCFVLIFWMKNRKEIDVDGSPRVPFPWFLLGFIAMSLFGSYVLGTYISVSQSVLNSVDFMTTFILTAAMVGLGLNVSLKDVKNKALRPLLAMVITSVLLSVLMFWIVLL
ncbi:putative integral membrane protein (TIGR00698 family) [Virgibacillus natechei]|uniref:Integral membrane protein (TIGR00698 family) n=1 Tax=Virgibacillus natechei TaxID=1216297 RepID=A0ABS4ILB6_9BACI|nr:putative sulfate exporter family transporter [Virgibacillus natechei]MBP1971201.1 putative integral membrane protein (TIGR00698 family) [Virgibacillus natechei]UZD11948.1 putative sulfate exporter family transporter [Virgibacillus natechei]